METTFSVRLIDVHKLDAVEHHLRWDVTVVVEVSSPFGRFDLNVRIPKAASLDSAVEQAIKQVGGWGSRFGEFGQKAISVREL
jgi:hypothetical protein